MTELRVATFNCEWRKPSSTDAAIILERLFSDNPDIVCLTEAHTDYFNGIGHTIDLGPKGTSRRKVVLWSREPWETADRVGSPHLPPGRFASGSTRTPLGTLQVYSVCIPYSMADVRYGEPKRGPWELHTTYLSALDTLMPTAPTRTLVIGDFNQRVPRHYQPPRVYAALDETLLSKFSLASGGPLEPLGLHAIDHICHSPDLRAVTRAVLSNERPSGGKISDHFGVTSNFVEQD